MYKEYIVVKAFCIQGPYNKYDEFKPGDKVTLENLQPFVSFYIKEKIVRPVDRDEKPSPDFAKSVPETKPDSKSEKLDKPEYVKL